MGRTAANNGTPRNRTSRRRAASSPRSKRRQYRSSTSGLHRPVFGETLKVVTKLSNARSKSLELKPGCRQISRCTRSRGFASSCRRIAVGVPAQILDGKALAADLRTELLARTSALREAQIHPKLAIVFVGQNESSSAYVRNLQRVAERAGVIVDIDQLPENASPQNVRRRLERFGSDASVHGVMLQQPLPKHLRIREIADAIPLTKDVDGTHPINQGNLALGSGVEYVPATPAAVMLLLERSPHWPLRGRRTVVVGRSVVVGAPVALLMLAQDATVTILHRGSGGFAPYLETAEVVVVATGVPGLIRGEDLAPGATVIDVGTTLVDGALKGDVDFESAVRVAGAITPVPGGVGPVTNIALLRNVVKSAEKHLTKS